MFLWKKSNIEVCERDTYTLEACRSKSHEAA